MLWITVLKERTRRFEQSKVEPIYTLEARSGGDPKGVPWASLSDAGMSWSPLRLASLGNMLSCASFVVHRDTTSPMERRRMDVVATQ